MAKPVIFGIGKLGLRLALAFLGVALTAIIVLSALTEIGIGHDINHLANKQERSLTRSVAVASAALYSQKGWKNADLMPVFELVDNEGAEAQITDMRGVVIQSTSGYGDARSDDQFAAPVRVHGHVVGVVTVKFNDRGLGAVVRQFEEQRLTSSLGAAGIVALIALAVSLIISRQITLPLERVLAAIRARGQGYRSMRISQAKGAGVVQELSLAINESSDAIDQRDRLQKNLVANIAHELRTPVAVLQASHEAMLDGVTAPTDENLWSLRDEVLRLARMIDDLQRLAAAESAALQLRLEASDLAEVAADAAASLADSFGAAGISLTKKLRPVWVLCDQDRMREIVVNLLTNALKFTPADGQVVLETGAAGHGLARLRVSDTGIGISPEELPRVAERFFRGQRSSAMATGSGIGLTIVVELIHAQRGNFDIASEPGQGTTASITMPAMKATERRTKRAAPSRAVDPPAEQHGSAASVRLAVGMITCAGRPRGDVGNDGGDSTARGRRAQTSGSSQVLS
jgi:two-component system sensor histidine kinase BaeS